MLVQASSNWFISVQGGLSCSRWIDHSQFKLVQAGPYGLVHSYSSLIILVQAGSSWFKPVQAESPRFKLTHLGSFWFNLVQTESPRFKLVHPDSKSVQAG
jgi:hypothetical protein